MHWKPYPKMNYPGQWIYRIQSITITESIRLGLSILCFSGHQISTIGQGFCWHMIALIINLMSVANRKEKHWKTHLMRSPRILCILTLFKKSSTTDAAQYEFNNCATMKTYFSFLCRRRSFSHISNSSAY